MSVNGVEIKVGQVWRRRDGTAVKVTAAKDITREFPIVAVGYDGGIERYTVHGTCNTTTNQKDLVELIEDAQPNGTNGVEIKVGQTWRRRDGSTVVIKRTGKIIFGLKEEFKVLDDTRAAYTCTGRYTLGGGSHERDLVELIEDVEPEQQQNAAQTPSAAFDAEITRMVTMRKSPFTAPDLLGAAAGHLRDRAATYDKPEGERSMAQTVALFNQYHGTALTEAQGWHFMQILKDVRLFANPSKPHRDSIEDGVAYCALKGEAMLKGDK